MKLFLFLFFLVFFLSSCHQMTVEEKIIDNYYIAASDDSDEKFLSFHENSDNQIYGSIIEPCVFAIGYNDKFIIAKQHPKEFGGRVNKTITNYYILPLFPKMNWRNRNGLIDPLTLEQFLFKRKELTISDSLMFSMEWE